MVVQSAVVQIRLIMLGHHQLGQEVLSPYDPFLSSLERKWITEMGLDRAGKEENKRTRNWKLRASKDVSERINETRREVEIHEEKEGEEARGLHAVRPSKRFRKSRVVVRNAP